MKVSEFVEVEDDYLMNVPPGADEPDGDTWEYYVFTNRVQTFKTGKKERVERKRELLTLKGQSKHDVDEQLIDLITREDVVFIPNQHTCDRG